MLIDNYFVQSSRLTSVTSDTGVIAAVAGLMFGMSSYCAPSSLRTLPPHHPVPLSTSSPAVAIPSTLQVHQPVTVA